MPDRQVIVERGKIYEKQPAPKNVIIDYEVPRVQIDRRVYDEGVYKINNPERYTSARPNGELRLVDRISDMPAPNATSYTTTVYKPTWNPARSVTPNKASQSLTDLRPKTSIVTSSIKGPIAYVGPWNTTYRTSYNAKGYNRK